MHKLKANTFSSVDGMRAELTRVLPCSYTQLGFIEPGHGLKGKTRHSGCETTMICHQCMLCTQGNVVVIFFYGV